MTTRVRFSGRQMQRIAERRRNGSAAARHGADRPSMSSDRLESLERELRERVDGEVRFDDGSRALYATAGSNYKEYPLGVVIPRDVAAAVEAVAVCRRHDAPLLPRGGGTSLAGQCCNVAVVLDCSKYLNRILEIDPDRAIARVEPGVIRDHVAIAAEERYGLTFAPDPSTHDHCAIGGMIGNNSCGVHSIMAGKTEENVIELEVLTYDGLRMRVGPTDEDELDRIASEGGRRGEIYEGLRSIRDRYADLIRERYPDIPRRVSGYNLNQLLPENGFNVARALVGTEGTCVTVLEATLRLVHNPPARSTLVLGFPDIYSAADAVPEIMEHGPIGLEGIDDRLVGYMQKKGMAVHEVDLLPDGGGWLLVEFGGETRDESDERAHEVMKALDSGGAPSMKLYDDPAAESRVWKVRESGLGATAYVPGEPETWEGFEDSAVPPERMGDYLRDLRRLFREHGYDGAFYGHFGQGCLHTRINFDLKTAAGIANFRSFMESAADLVTSYGGSLSGEHGDGQSRAELLPRMFGEELVQAFREFKAVWDPRAKMNPNKVVDAHPIDANLRLGVDYRPAESDTAFRYPDDGGSFAHAALRCVGVGTCRRWDGGTMCPSYMVTHEEKHSTRGRARLLFEMLQGEVITEGWRSDHVHEALDLCLSCKGCKGDCPVDVDIATYKAEFLSHYYRRRLRPVQAYTMGLIMFHARLAARMPRLANAVASAPLLGRLVKGAAGISPRRRLPRFAPEPFTSWFRRRGAVNPHGEPVVLFPDTFSNFLSPETARAAVEVLETAGRRVVLPDRPLCCGRPLYDYGMLDTAKRFWSRNLASLAPSARAGVPIVGLEPSCVAAFRDELPAMRPKDEDAQRLARAVVTLAEFLDEHAPDWEVGRLGRHAIVHGHCHQKAIMGMDADRRIYERLGLEFELLDSGCCGMAGSFGFEADHYDISVAIGERKLLPAVRAAASETLLIADGFSCRTQIEELTGRHALHTAEVARMALSG
jgi:FAD/FMN-containing dehydrogenase/Fe-S oxidoreductase